jgi:hypothetical protein
MMHQYYALLNCSHKKIIQFAHVRPELKMHFGSVADVPKKGLLHDMREAQLKANGGRLRAEASQAAQTAPGSIRSMQREVDPSAIESRIEQVRTSLGAQML